MKKALNIGVLLWIEQEYGRQVCLGARAYSGHFTGATVTIRPVVARMRGEQREDEYRELNNLDGVILTVSHANIDFRIPRIKVPIVECPLFSRPGKALTVTTDAKQIGRIAARHFLDMRFRNITVVLNHRNDDVSDLVTGMREEVSSAGIEMIEPRLFASHNRSAVGEWLRSLPLPVGLLGDTDSTANILMKAALEAGLEVPGDVSVVGIGDDVLGNITARNPVTLSSIPVQAFHLGELACRTLASLLCGSQVTSVLLPPLPVSHRQSSNAVAAGDPLVQEAARFIRANSSSPLRTADIARHAGVPRRTLEYRFKRAMACTLHDEIAHCRLNRAKALLAVPGNQIKSVALACGLRTTDNFVRFFKRLTGTTPKKYRQEIRTSSVQ